MHLDRRNTDRLERVMYRDARMSISRGVNYYRIDFFIIRLLDYVNERALVVRLEKLRLHAVLFAARADIFNKIVIGLPAVDIRLPYAEHIHIGPVNNINLHL
jgi:hypothetical protein